jgi:hypothetical protein
VQGILEAAQATAETIEREAAQDAQRTRDTANADAKRTREEAIARARGHVAEVSKVTAGLLERVGSMDGETRALIDSLHTGASRLAGDLAAVETNMEALYDAAASRSGRGEAETESAGDYNEVEQAPVAVPAPEPQSHGEPFVELLAEPHAEAHGDPHAEADAHPHAGVTPQSAGLAPEEEPSFSADEYEEDHAESSPAVLGDLDGARLVALNMALNGDSREETGDYLAENFDVPDRERLLDEVYAAIEG